MISHLNISRTVLLELDTSSLNFNYELDLSILSDKLKAMQGYVFERSEVGTLLLFKYNWKFGITESIRLYNQIDKISKHIKISHGTIYVLNNLIDYCIVKNKNIFLINNEDMGQFAKTFFNSINDRKVNIRQYQQFWNDFIELFGDCIVNINKEQLKVKTKRLSGNATIIKIKNNKKIKDKLITEVPLEVSDEKSIFILKEKVTQNLYIEE